MRVEVDDEAAHLRKRQSPANPEAVDQPRKTAVKGDADSDCDDCGDSLHSCRCNPGEG